MVLLARDEHGRSLSIVHEARYAWQRVWAKLFESVSGGSKNALDVLPQSLHLMDAENTLLYLGHGYELKPDTQERSRMR